MVIKIFILKVTTYNRKTCTSKSSKTMKYDVIWIELRKCIANNATVFLKLNLKGCNSVSLLSRSRVCK